MTNPTATPSTTKDFLTIVSGLPRSGTSMMMKMLEAGGMPVVVDNIRTADDDNPRGYYEFEPVKHTKEDARWIDDTHGQAVKMVYSLVYDMPPDHHYRVLLMRRHIDEILASQQAMLRRMGTDDDGISDEQLSALFTSQLADFNRWVAQQKNIRMMEVNYNAMLEEPRGELERINSFLGGGLDLEAMAAVVDASLYRNRK